MVLYVGQCAKLRGRLVEPLHDRFEGINSKHNYSASISSPELNTTSQKSWLTRQNRIFGWSSTNKAKLTRLLRSAALLEESQDPIQTALTNSWHQSRNAPEIKDQLRRDLSREKSSHLSIDTQNSSADRDTDRPSWLRPLGAF